MKRTMKKYNFYLVVIIGLIYFSNSVIGQNNNGILTKYVNPFIGTGVIEGSALSGNNYPGVSVPFGMVQLSPDTKDTPNWGAASGYDYNDNRIYGFSHTHLSGTGVAELFDILLLPYTGDLKFNGSENAFYSHFSHETEEAFPGYYKVELSDFDIKAELTASPHAGYHRYTYHGKGSRKVLFDLNHSMRKSDWNTNIISSQIEMVNDSTIRGYRIITGWAPLRKIYFYAKFSQPIVKTTVFSGNERYDNERVVNGKGLKAILNFEDGLSEVSVQIGISQVSKENAKMNLESEIKGWDFNSVTNSSNLKWEHELQKIKIEGEEKMKEIFYTAMYHSFLQPNNIADVNGEYVAPDFTINKSKSKSYYSTFSLWDTYRGAHPLYTLVQPKRSADFVNSMLDYYDSFGILPIWQLWGQENYCMIGNHSIPVIVDAAFSGIKGFDLQRAYEAIKKSSETDHFNSPFNVWEKYGYFPENIQSQSVSLALEVAYDDWCVAMLAKKLEKKDDYEHFLMRSKFYKNLYDDSTGFFRAKDDQNNWIEPFDPLSYGANGGNPFTEGNAWQYFWYVPHDIAGLINLVGGSEKFNEKLDTFFTLDDNLVDKNDNASGFIGQYAHGNEPSHHIAYLYDYIGKPWKTQFYVSEILEKMYNTSTSGYAGNEDCGELSSWYVFSSMGFYPVNPTGQIFSIGTPIFEKTILNYSKENQFIITAKNVSKENIYIQSAKLNGMKYSKNYLLKEDIMKGGTLEFVMGNKPNKHWGNRNEDIPTNAKMNDFFAN